MSSQSVQETIPFSNLNPWNRTVLAPNIRKIWSIRESSSPHSDTLIHIHSQFSYNNLRECPQATAEKLNEKWKTNVTQLWQPSHKSRLPSYRWAAYSSSLPSSLVSLIMSSILRIVMAASVANCSRMEKDDGIELGHHKYHDEKETRGQTWIIFTLLIDGSITPYSRLLRMIPLERSRPILHSKEVNLMAIPAQVAEVNHT